jgi:hypothetical protein
LLRRAFIRDKGSLQKVQQGLGVTIDSSYVPNVHHRIYVVPNPSKQGPWDFEAEVFKLKITLDLLHFWSWKTGMQLDADEPLATFATAYDWWKDPVSIIVASYMKITCPRRDLRYPQPEPEPQPMVKAETVSRSEAEDEARRLSLAIVEYEQQTIEKDTGQIPEYFF